MPTFLHASDFQCGKPFVPAAGEALVGFADALAPDATIVAGDLTQRAKRSEFMTAMALVRRLPKPVVVTPGNHDVPLYRFWERGLSPYRNWRRFVSPELDSVTRIDGAMLVALNSSSPRRAIVNGRIRGRQVAFAREAFEAAADGELRVLVIHHHFVPTPLGKGSATLPGAARLLSQFEAMGVDMILGGHVHHTHVKSSRDVIPGDGPGIPVIACGTTTSVRGRPPEVLRNSLNVVRVDETEIQVAPHMLSDEGSFESMEPFVFRRWRPAGSFPDGAGPAGEEVGAE